MATSVSAQEQGERRTLRDWLRADIRLRKRLALADLAATARDLALMTSAGVQIRDAVGIAAQQNAKRASGAVLADVYRRISEDGWSVADAFGAHTAEVTPFWVAVVQAGEMVGDLPAAFERLTTLYERNIRLRKQLRSMSIYPIGTLLFTLLLVLLLAVYVLPRYKSFLSALGGHLPGLTVVVTETSVFIAHWIVPIILAIALAAFGTWWLFQTNEDLHWRLDRLLLRLPVFGRLLMLANLSISSSILGSCLEGNLPVVSSLEYAAQSTRNRVYRRFLLDAADRVTNEGRSVTRALAVSADVPPMLEHIVRVGEESGSLGAALLQLAAQSDTSLTYAMQAVTSTVDVLIILPIAVIVGVVVIAIYLPILRAYSVVNHLR